MIVTRPLGGGEAKTMGDYILERQLNNALKNLDDAIARGDRLGATLANDQVNRIRARMRTPVREPNPLVSRLPRFVQSAIENRGIRLPALERALKTDKVVVTGTLKNGAPMAVLKINF